MATRSRIASLLLCIQILVARVAAEIKFGDPGKDDYQIVGGSPADTHIFAAYVAFANNECGGILINKNRVLTAAHCVQSGHPETVRVGAMNRTGGIEVGVRCAKSHPNYVWPRFQYDIAVLKLEDDLIGIPAPILNVDLDYPRQPGQQLLLAGMGRNSTAGFYSDTLEQISYQFVGENECKRIYQSRITRGLHVCAYDRDEGACFGDAGGPLFDDVEPRWLVGISTGATGGCADTFTPDVYANVAAFADWIADQELDTSCDVQCVGCLCDAYEFMGQISTAVSSGVTSFAGGVASFFAP